MLEEGFWSALKAGGRGVAGALGAGVGLAADALDVVAPKVTQPLKSIESRGRQMGRDAKENFLRTWKGKDRFIADKLLDASFQMDMSKKPKKLPGNERLVYAHKIIDYDKKGKPVLDHYQNGGVKNAVPLIVNSETGQISKNINQAKVFNKQKK